MLNFRGDHGYPKHPFLIPPSVNSLKILMFAGAAKDDFFRARLDNMIGGTIPNCLRMLRNIIVNTSRETALRLAAL